MNRARLKEALGERRQPITIKAVRDLTRFDIPRAIGINHIAIDGAPPVGEEVNGPFDLNFSRHDPILTSIRRILIYADAGGENQTVNLANGVCVLDRKKHAAIIVLPRSEPSGQTLVYTLRSTGVAVDVLENSADESILRASKLANRGISALKVAHRIATADKFIS